MFDTIDRTTHTRSKFEATFFGEIVLLSETRKADFAEYIEHVHGEQLAKVKKNENVTTFRWAVSRKYFDLMIAENGSDPSWMNKIPSREELCAIDPETMKKYQEGDNPRIGYPYDADLLETLKSGRYDLIVQENSKDDGFLYDVHGEKIMRDFAPDYLAQHVYRLKPLLAHLQNHPQVKNIETGEIPYYNSEFTGEKFIKFRFSPNPQQFQEIVNGKYIWDGEKKIKEILEIEQFRKDRQENEDDI